MPQKALLHIRLGEVNTLPYQNSLAETINNQFPNWLFVDLDNHVESWLVNKSAELLQAANQVIIAIENFGIESGIRPFLNLLKSLHESGKLERIYIIHDPSTAQYLEGFFDGVDLIELKNSDKLADILEIKNT
ncbi:hypothetical protein [Peijinzhouia sedimentorum]